MMRETRISLKKLLRQADFVSMISEKDIIVSNYANGVCLMIDGVSTKYKSNKDAYKYLEEIEYKLSGISRNGL